jgi:hypothetical protein
MWLRVGCVGIESHKDRIFNLTGANWSDDAIHRGYDQFGGSKADVDILVSY